MYVIFFSFCKNCHRAQAQLQLIINLHNLTTLPGAPGKEIYQDKISKSFSVLESLGHSVDILKAWDTIRVNINISTTESLGYYELREHKPWFDEGYSKLSDQGNKPNCNGYRIQVR
jgi:hypothetical protein